MSARALLRFLLISGLVLAVFALLWPLLAPGYGEAQIALLRFFLSPQVRPLLDSEGIAIYFQDKLLVRRDFISWAGVGLTLALWLATPRLRWKERIVGLVLGWGVLFLCHIFLLMGLISFAQALAEHRATGWQTLLYGFIAVSDGVIPVLIWGLPVLASWFRRGPVDRDHPP